jgi:RNA polymerase sigma-70 factor (ECF subfamily)
MQTVTSSRQQLEIVITIRKPVGRSKMPSTVVDQIDAREATIASFHDPAREEVLVAAARNGNEQAFEILVKRYEQRILAVAQRYTRAQEDAKDVVQQTFQKAFVHLPSFESKSSFSTWLTRIAINEGLMLLRRRHALHEVPVDQSSERDENTGYPEMPDSRSDPEANYARREQVRILIAALGNLRPGLRRAVELRDLGELSTSETARRMGLSVAAVKGRLFHARRELRQALTRYLKLVRMPRNDTSVGDLKGTPRGLGCTSRS